MRAGSGSTTARRWGSPCSPGPPRPTKTMPTSVTVWMERAMSTATATTTSSSALPYTTTEAPMRVGPPSSTAVRPDSKTHPRGPTRTTTQALAWVGQSRALGTSTAMATRTSWWALHIGRAIRARPTCFSALPTVSAGLSRGPQRAAPPTSEWGGGSRVWATSTPMASMTLRWAGMSTTTAVAVCRCTSAGLTPTASTCTMLPSTAHPRTPTEVAPSRRPAMSTAMDSPT